MLNTRLALLELAARHKLDARQRAELWRLARFGEEPARLTYWAKRSLALVGAALGGLGLIFWVAANWNAMSRIAHFAILQGFTLAMFAGAALLPAARQALSLAALLAVGALLGYFGQTYQTGADAWQLFAVWALAALPLCFAARGDTLWSAWAVIATVGIARWDYAHSGYAWSSASGSILVHSIAWITALTLAFLLSKRMRSYTGAGTWAFATALTLSTLIVSSTALSGLFGQDIAPYYWLGLLILGCAATLLASSSYFDIYGLSVIGLALNVLIVGALVHMLLAKVSSAGAGELFVLAVVAAGLLAVTLRLILELAGKHGEGRQHG